MPGLTSLLFIAAAAGCLFAAFWFSSQARHLRAIPRARIRSAPQGYVEIFGRAKSLSSVPYRTPEDGRPCVWFEYRYREPGSEEGIPGTTLRTSQSFLIEDETGSCRVDPVSMRIETRSRKDNFFNKWSLTAQPGLISLRWIGVGEKVHAYGKFTTLSSDFSSRKKDMIQSRLQALKRDREMMSRLDRDGDGIISGDEWEQAREGIVREVEVEILELQKQQDQRALGHVLRAPDDGRLPYLVSSFAQMNIVSRYRLLALFFGLLFLLLGGAIVDAYFVDWVGYEFDRLLEVPSR